MIAGANLMKPLSWGGVLEGLSPSVLVRDLRIALLHPLLNVVYDALRPRIGDLVDHLQTLAGRRYDPTAFEVNQVLRNSSLMKAKALLHVFHVAPPHLQKSIYNFQPYGVPESFKNLGLSGELHRLYEMKQFIQFSGNLFYGFSLRIHSL
jgi:hypothetical protein